ncbi:MAG: heme biosynthesis HemY N-terminal domain-containing protein, partial [Deltaproteobacteria bacterium]
MVRLVLFLVAILLLASGLAWLADRPGQLLITWEAYEVETSVFRAVVIFALVIGAVILLWSLLRQIWSSPSIISKHLTRRRQQRGLDALSSGMIAIGAGDRASAARAAIQARRTIPNEPLTHLLRAQAAQLTGDRATARRIFEAMLGSPDTEPLGLRGLYLEARREGVHEAAMQFADRAAKLNPRLGWPLEAKFEMQVKSADWAGAAETASIAKRSGHL